MARIGRVTGRAVGRKKLDQRGGLVEVRPRTFPQPEPDEVSCPVCHYPARRFTRLDQVPARYAHDFRMFPCRSDWVAVTPEEMIANARPARAW